MYLTHISLLLSLGLWGSLLFLLHVVLRMVSGRRKRKEAALGSVFTGDTELITAVSHSEDNHTHQRTFGFFHQATAFNVSDLS